MPILSHISLPWPSYSPLCLKFPCHGNQGQLWQNLSDVIQWHNRKKTPTRRKHLRDISHTSWVMAHFVSNFVAMATRVSRNRICLASFNSTIAKKPTMHKQLGDISHTSWVMAHFVSNFVAMTTSVGRGRICLTSFNSPTPKTPCWTQRSPRYLVFKPSYSRFFSQISLP